MVACVNSAVAYPYITVLMRPVFPLSMATMNVFVGDCVLLFDILLNFCTAVLLDEDSETYEIDHFRLAERYVFKGGFLKDVILWFPFGQILLRVWKPLQAIELIKVLRFDAVLDAISKKNTIPAIREGLKLEEEKVIKDSSRNDDSSRDQMRILIKLYFLKAFHII